MIPKPPAAAIAISATIVAATPVAAETSENFARLVWPHVNFLDQSSRIAMARSKNGKLRLYARSEASEQTVVANALVAWTEAKIAAQEPSPEPQGAPSQGGTLLAAPFRAASRATSGVADAIDGVQTGRSIATDGRAAGRHLSLREVRLTRDEGNLNELRALSGQAFDDFYLSTQKDALLQLSTLYVSYIQNGDDAALKALAIRALPGINIRLAILKTLD